MPKKKALAAAAEDKGQRTDFDEEFYRVNAANNLGTILSAMEWTQKKLADEMAIAQATVTDYVRGQRLPSLPSILRLINSREIQKKIPFTVDQFLSGDIREGDAGGGDYARDQEEGVHEDIPGTYFLYFFDQKIQEVGAVPQMRRLRYGVLGLYETAGKNGGVRVPAFARFFKSEEAAAAFRRELEELREDGKENPEKEIARFRSSGDAYVGAAVQIGSHIYIDLFSAFYNDKGLIVLTAPEKKTGTEYIGGLGSALSVTRGAEHIPAAQKIILSREIIEASDEEITAHLLYGDVRVEVDGEMRELLDLMEALYAPSEGGPTEQLLDEEDRRAIVRRRMQRLINDYVARTFHGLCLVSKQDDHACYQFLKQRA